MGQDRGLEVLCIGVPRGSLLGLKKFVNDPLESIKGELYIYVDDTTAYCVGKA